MAHRHYHTEGFILSERPLREKDILIHVFTKDLGLVRASVRSARDIRSKLRPHLSRYAQVAISLVRGKEYWKVVALETTDLMPSIWSDRTSAVPAARIFALLERLVSGEEAAPELYADFAAALALLAELPTTERKDLATNLECIAVLKIMDRLGYLPRLPLFEPFVSSPLDLALVRSVAPVRLEAIRTINRAFEDASV